MNECDKPDWSKEFWTVGNKIYAQCERCGGVVRINKPFFGAMHLCDPPEGKRSGRT